MNCEKYKNMIPEYLSGELGEKDRSELTDHLKNCADCSEELEFESRILNSLSDEIYNIPDGLNDSIISTLPDRRSIFNRHFTRYAVAASFFFLVIMSYFMLDPAIERPAVMKTDTNAYYSEYVLGSEYDELISYNAVLYAEDKWTSEDTDIFDSESDIINDLLTLEELESYDSYLTSL